MPRFRLLLGQCGVNCKFTEKDDQRGQCKKSSSFGTFTLKECRGIYKQEQTKVFETCESKGTS